jgi:HEAT repeat protein
MLAHGLAVVTFLLIPQPSVVGGSGQPDVSELVRQLGGFPAAIDGRVNSTTGGPPPQEQQRTAIYVQLRTLGAAAIPALTKGLADPDVRIRRNVALYLTWEGGNYSKHAPEPLDVRPFVPALVRALRDADERVAGLAGHALAHAGSAAAVAVPDLLRLLADPREGLRNSACIGLAGIGPAAADAVPALQRALSDPSQDVRRFAQRALDHIAPKAPRESATPARSHHA